MMTTRTSRRRRHGSRRLLLGQVIEALLTLSLMVDEAAMRRLDEGNGVTPLLAALSIFDQDDHQQHQRCLSGAEDLIEKKTRKIQVINPHFFPTFFEL
jgi:hypothetical protein